MKQLSTVKQKIWIKKQAMNESNLQYLYLIHKLYFITFVLVYEVMVHARFSNAQ